MADLTTVAALEVRLKVPTGSLSGADLDYAEACLTDASALVRAASGRDWIDGETGAANAPASLVAVALQAALRAYRNPDGVAGENFGAYSYNLPQGETGVGLTSREVAICEKVAASFGASGGGGNFTGSMRVRSAYHDPDEYAREEVVYTL
jgi:hypothetical protein